MKLRTISLVGVSVAALSVTGAQAQSPQSASAPEPTETQASQLEEVVVSARRRSESLQKVPLSVAAVTPTQLLQASIANSQDLPRVTPGLTIGQSTGQSNGMQVSLRGQAQTDFSGNTDPSVGLYFDGFYVAYNIGANLALYDLQGVEVAKGPQGTLFGRNTTGGAVSVFTKQPGQDFGGYFKGNIGDYGAYGLQGAVTLPVSDQLAFRIAADRQYHDGYINVVNGPDVDDQDSISGRINMLWTPTETLSVSVGAFGSQVEENGTGMIAVAAAPALFPFPACAAVPPRGQTVLDSGGCANALTGGALTGLIAAQQKDPRTVTLNPSRGTDIKVGGVNATVVAELGDVTLKYLVGYRRVQRLAGGDQDGTAIDILRADLFADDLWQFSNELLLQGRAFDGRVDWQGGLYYLRQGGEGSTVASAFGLLGANAPRATNSMYTIDNDSYSAFTQFTLRATDRLRLTAGARYTADTKRSLYGSVSGSDFATGICQNTTATGVVLNPCGVNASSDFSGVSWTASVDYDLTPDILLYATSRRGFRAGGIPVRSTIPSTAAPFRPETVQDYEVGIKSSFHLGDMPVRLNLAAFYDDYKDIQRTVLVAAPPPLLTQQTTTFNAAAGHVTGAELELVARPSTSLEVRLGATAALARYDEFDYTSTVSLKDTALPQAPDYTVSASFRWSLPITSLGGVSFDELALAGNARYQSETCVANLCHREQVIQEGYTLLDASFVVDNIGGSGVSARVYGKNLTNELYKDGAFDLWSGIPFGVVSVHYGAPRTWGFELTKTFGGG